MKIEVVNLGEGNLGDAPEWRTHPFSCKYCLYWELPHECLDPAKEIREEALLKKLDWLRDTQQRFGRCGKLLYVNGKAVAYCQYAPPRFLPRSLDYGSGPASDDAVLLSCLFIPQNRFRRSGFGSHLLHAMMDELRDRGTGAVETFARRSSADNPSGPIEFYLKHGFAVQKDDSDFPLVRLKL